MIAQNKTYKKEVQMKRKRLPNNEIIKAYEKKAANVSATATALGIHRSSLIRWRNDDKELDEGMKDIEESLVDFSESKLMEAINEGNLTAIIFHLKTKGRSRGYIEKTEQDVNVNAFEQLMKELPEED